MSTPANSSLHVCVCALSIKRGFNLYLSPWQLSRCHAGVSSEAIRDVESAGFKGFDADRDQSGTKRHERKSKKCLPVLPPWPKASRCYPEANGNDAFFFWSVGKAWSFKFLSLSQENVTLLFGWQDKWQDERCAACVGYPGSYWSGTMTLQGGGRQNWAVKALHWTETSERTALHEWG